jgi:lipopolysaccharide biosynthesis protein
LRRAVFYLFYDPQGQVDGYVLHALAHLRAHAELVFVVSNAPLDAANRARLETVADTVWSRENVGFDVWAYKDAMEQVGRERLAEFDEVLLCNSTFLGPLDSFDAVFAEMDARADIDFWGITEHGAARKHPFQRNRPIAAHLQSHWIASRRRMVTSPEWAEYWDEMPMISSYADSVLLHESRFTPWFEERGYTSAAAFPAANYGSPHPVMDNPVELVRDGCPIVKRRSFFYDPLYNEWKANDGRQLARMMAERGYPMEHLYSNLARTSKPRWLATNLGLMDVLPEVDLGYDHDRPLRVVGIAHIFYPEMTDEIVDRLDFLPHGYDLVVTTTDEEKRDVIAAALERRGRAADLRIVKSNRGRDISAFFIDCKDVLESGDYDVVVKVHSKKQPQDPPNVQELFKRHMFDNLLSSPGYAANVLRLFQQQPTLGMVFPPVYHISYPTLGHAWFLNKPRAEEEAKRLGIHVPFDDNTPLSAYGSFFIARPEALRVLTSAGYRHDDFPDESDYRDGALTHVVERLVSYAVLSTGHHCREVMNAELAATNYSYLEYRAIAVGSKLPAYPRAQIKRISKLKRIRKQALRIGMFAVGDGGREPEEKQARRRLLSRIRR